MVSQRAALESVLADPGRTYLHERTATRLARARTHRRADYTRQPGPTVPELVPATPGTPTRGRRPLSRLGRPRHQATRQRPLEVLAWIDGHELTLGTVGQENIDSWIAERGSQRRYLIRYFLTWTVSLYRSNLRFWLRCLRVFVDQFVEDLSTADPRRDEDGGRPGVRGVGWALVTALVWSALVIVHNELSQDAQQVPRVVDQHPVQTLPADRAYPPFPGRRARRLR
jgi:hypothetical protein